MRTPTKSFLHISISPPRPFGGLGLLLRQHLNGGIERVHLRFPSCDTESYRRVLEEMDLHPDLEGRVSIGDHFGLLDDYPRLGVHLSTSKRGDYPSPRTHFGNERMISTSTHSAKELAGLPPVDYDYAFLGPVYPSISKPGYGPSEEGQLLMGELPQGKEHVAAVALGGITPERLTAIRGAGFRGAAMLGGLWQDLSSEGQAGLVAHFAGG